MPAISIYRLAAGLTGAFAVLLQAWLILDAAGADNKSYVAELIRLLSFMTIWSNIVATLCWLFPLVSPLSKWSRFLSKPLVESGILVYITIVMLVYHFFLAAVWEPKGWQKVADIILHYVVPALFIIYWMLFTTKGTLVYKDAVRWLVYPVVYILYSLIRGALTHEYPYYFADAYKLGYPVAMRNMTFVLLAYLIAGLIVVLTDRLLSQKKSA